MDGSCWHWLSGERARAAAMAAPGGVRFVVVAVVEVKVGVVGGR